jgi:hypothetical protein
VVGCLKYAPKFLPCACILRMELLLKFRRIIKKSRLRPRLAGLHFTSEAIFICLSSTNSSISGAEFVLVNCLAKRLPCESMFLGAWRRSREEPREATFFWLYPTSNHCESMFLGALPVKLFYFTPFNRKRLLKLTKKPCQI